MERISQRQSKLLYSDSAYRDITSEKQHLGTKTSSYNFSLYSVASDRPLSDDSLPVTGRERSSVIRTQTSKLKFERSSVLKFDNKTCFEMKSMSRELSKKAESKHEKILHRIHASMVMKNQPENLEKFAPAVKHVRKQVNLQDLVKEASNQIILLILPVICTVLYAISIKSMLLGSYKSDNETRWNTMGFLMIVLTFVCLIFAAIAIFQLFKLFQMISVFVHWIITMITTFFVLGTAVQYMGIPFDCVSMIVLTWNISVIFIIILFVKGSKIARAGIHCYLAGNITILISLYLPRITYWIMFSLLMITDMIFSLRKCHASRFLMLSLKSLNGNMMSGFLYADLMIREEDSAATIRSSTAVKSVDEDSENNHNQKRNMTETDWQGSSTTDLYSMNADADTCIPDREISTVGQGATLDRTNVMDSLSAIAMDSPRPSSVRFIPNAKKIARYIREKTKELSYPPEIPKLVGKFCDSDTDTVNTDYSDTWRSSLKKRFSTMRSKLNVDNNQDALPAIVFQPGFLSNFRRFGSVRLHTELGDIRDVLFEVQKHEDKNVHLGVFDMVMITSLILDVARTWTVVCGCALTVAVGLILTDVQMFSRRHVLFATPIIFLLCFFAYCWIDTCADMFIAVLAKNQVFM